MRPTKRLHRAIHTGSVVIVADVNVRAVPDDVVARLREQAAAEGVSMSE
jgi:hypothetical protein